MATPSTPSFLLRVVLSCRRLEACVKNPFTNSIIAMASTHEPELVPLCKEEGMNRKSYKLVDDKISSKVGEMLGGRLREKGVQEVEIDLFEEKMRPLCERRVVEGLFASIEEAGVKLLGAEELKKLQ